MQTQRQTAVETHSGLSRGLNFLLVDDDDICLFIHRKVLATTGYCTSAYSAGNGERAMEMLGMAEAGLKPFPDIILLDKEMPLMNGIQFLETITQQKTLSGRSTRIVLLTSSICDREIQYALTLGVSHYLPKPLTKEALDLVVIQTYGQLTISKRP